FPPYFPSSKYIDLSHLLHIKNKKLNEKNQKVNHIAMSTTRIVVLTISGIVLAMILIVVIGLAIIVSIFRGRPPSIHDNSVLALNVSGSLPDYVPDDPIRRIFGGQPQSLTSLITQFRKAKADKRI